MLCGLGGVLMGLVQGLASPEHAFWSRSAELVFIAVLTTGLGFYLMANSARVEGEIGLDGTEAAAH